MAVQDLNTGSSHRFLISNCATDALEVAAVFRAGAKTRTRTKTAMEKPKHNKLDQTVITARRASELRDQGYRARALKMYPHLCGRCAREFERENLHELTVHHRDHNHDNNPSDGSNWELLCLYCHDNEHQRQVEAQRGNAAIANDLTAAATFNPFADLKSILTEKK